MLTSNTAARELPLVLNQFIGSMLNNSYTGANHSLTNPKSGLSKPLKTKIGNFEWQLISGRLESSGYLPANSDFQYAGTNIYVPKINQKGETDDWRYLQGYSITYSPKWVPDGSKMTQDGPIWPKMAPRWPKMVQATLGCRHRPDQNIVKPSGQ